MTKGAAKIGSSGGFLQIIKGKIWNFRVLDTLILILLCLAIAVLAFSLLMRKGRKPLPHQPFPEDWRPTLLRDIPFYRQLEPAAQSEFEQRMMQFLATTRITGVNTAVDDLDRIYIAASAIIPIFRFKDWEYINLHEILLYPDAFDHEFQQAGANRSILGMVGTGALNNLMVLSQHELRQAFLNKTGKSNTAIHEFIHLLDKTDGSIDGLPAFFLDKQYLLPWLQLMQEHIRQISQGQSDIDPYAATNTAEFFAVISEYFFERPDLLQQKHPRLYAQLVRIFREPAGKTSGDRTG